MRLVFACLSLMLVGASAAPRSELSQGWHLEATSGDLVHDLSDLRFPAHFESMVRGEPTTYDSTGANVSVRYGTPDWTRALTFYIYPQGRQTWMEFEGVLSTIVRCHDSAFINSMKKESIVLGDHATTVHAAGLEYRVEGVELGSWILLTTDHGRFYKIRLSFNAEDSLASRGAFASAMRFLVLVGSGS